MPFAEPQGRAEQAIEVLREHLLEGPRGGSSAAGFQRVDSLTSVASACVVQPPTTLETPDDQNSFRRLRLGGGARRPHASSGTRVAALARDLDELSHVATGRR